MYHEVPETLFYQRVHAEASGNLRSAAAQQSFMNPAHTTRCANTRLKLLAGYVKAIRNAELSRLDRWRCYAALVSYVCQFRKWGRVLRTTLTGTGIKCHQATDSLSPTETAPHSHKQAAT